MFLVIFSGFTQMSQFFSSVFSKYQCGFQKSFSARQCLLVMPKKWKKSVDNEKAFGVLMTNFSKAFDWFDHELLIA